MSLKICMKCNTTRFKDIALESDFEISKQLLSFQCQKKTLPDLRVWKCIFKALIVQDVQ